MAENMDATGSGEQQEKRGMSRRTVLAGAAWSVPVIAVATAAPAMAASPPVIVDFDGLACKHPGASGTPGDPGGAEFKTYHFDLTVENTTLTDVTVDITSFTVNGVTAGTIVSFPAEPISVPAGTTISFYVHVGPYPDSANANATICYTYTPTGGETSEVFCTSSGPLNTPPCPGNVP
jgi:hypothetical protein